MINRGDEIWLHRANEIRSAIYRSVGWVFDLSPGRAAIVSDLQKWRMIASKSGIFDFSAQLSGLGSAGQAFCIRDISALQVKEGDHPGFQGAIVSFKQAAPFNGRTLIVEDRGVYNPTTLDLMPRIKFRDQQFENIFEVYGDDLDEAARIFTAGYVQKMTEFSRETLGHKLQSCLIGDEVHFILDINRHFSFSTTPETGSIEKLKKDMVLEAGKICVLLEKLYCIQASIGQVDNPRSKSERLAYYEKCLKRMMICIKTMQFDADFNPTIQAA